MIYNSGANTLVVPLILIVKPLGVVHHRLPVSDAEALKKPQRDMNKKSPFGDLEPMRYFSRMSDVPNQQNCPLD